MRINDTDKILRNHKDFSKKGMTSNQLKGLYRDIRDYEQGKMLQPYELRRLVTRLIRRLDYLDVSYWRDSFKKEK